MSPHPSQQTIILFFTLPFFSGPATASKESGSVMTRCKLECVDARSSSPMEGGSMKEWVFVYCIVILTGRMEDNADGRKEKCERQNRSRSEAGISGAIQAFTASD
ncbi:hypothetical protein HHX47_DHR1002053 [Lentinula edodes]|nr:hypothetical protein HHX47_DHR1002053 [Lentinula edodes]